MYQQFKMTNGCDVTTTKIFAYDLQYGSAQSINTTKNCKNHAEYSKVQKICIHH